MTTATETTTTEITKEVSLTKKQWAALIKCASSKQQRLPLDRLAVYPCGTVAATNGVIMLVVDPDDASRKQTPTMLDVTLLKTALKLGKPGDAFKVGAAGDDGKIRLGDVTMPVVADKDQREFPHYQLLGAPAESSTKPTRLSPLRLSTLTAAMACFTENRDGQQTATLVRLGGETVTTLTHQRVIGFIMPMRVD